MQPHIGKFYFQTQPGTQRCQEHLQAGLPEELPVEFAKDLINLEKSFLPFPLQRQFMSQLNAAAIEQKNGTRFILGWSDRPDTET
jgi:hypothetical protein